MFVDGRFSLSTGLRLAFLTLSPIQELHNIGFVHRDIKVERSLVGIKEHYRHPTSVLSRILQMTAWRSCWLIMDSVGTSARKTEKSSQLERMFVSGEKHAYIFVSVLWFSGQLTEIMNFEVARNSCVIEEFLEVQLDTHLWRHTMKQNSHQKMI